MRTIGLLTHYYSTEYLEKEIHEMYVKTETEDLSHTVRAAEDEDVRVLTEVLLETGNCDWKSTEGFYYGYKIPRISKEFDLLRIGRDLLIDIELKHQNTGDRMKAQLLQNTGYLELLKRTIHCYTFVAEERQIYRLKGNDFCAVKPIELMNDLKNQQMIEIEDIDSLFDPSAYLISPFSSPERYLAREYFLTAQQEQIRNEILETASTEGFFGMIEGKTGTGKSLLLYDLVDAFGMRYGWQRYEVAVVHCGTQCEGHRVLSRAGYRLWSPDRIEDIVKDANVKAILIDEAERLEEKYRKILSDAMVPVVAAVEEGMPRGGNRYSFVRNVPDGKKVYTWKLSNRIRVNHDLALFVEKLFDYSSPGYFHGNLPVRLVQTPDHETTESLQEYYRKEGWIVPDVYRGAGIHTEYEKVAVVMRNGYYYKDCILCHADRGKVDELYETITRARSALAVIVEEDPKLFSELVETLHAAVQSK